MPHSSGVAAIHHAKFYHSYPIPRCNSQSAIGQGHNIHHVFWKQWFDRGVTFISDLMNSNGKFLTFEEFQNKFEIKANYLHYFQLIAAIPPDLKRKAFGSTVPDLLGATSEYCQIEDRTIVLTKFRCKNYYSLFIEKLASEPSAVRAWKKSFSELPDWGDCFVNFIQALER